MKGITCDQRQMLPHSRMAVHRHVAVPVYCWVLVLLLLVLPLASLVVLTEYGMPLEAFIGWSGELHRSTDPLALSGQAGRHPSKRAWVEVISWKPRASVYHNFLTEEEAMHLKRLAAPTMKRSSVSVADNGSTIVDGARTSYSTWLTRKFDIVLERIEERAANWAMIPPVHQEDTQVVRYAPGQWFEPHIDNYEDEEAGERVATVLMYLSDVQEGGETAFPDRSEWLYRKAGPTYDKEFSACAKGHVALKPKLGDALLFWTITSEYGQEADFHSKHVGCPVVKGIKWTAEEYYGAPEDRSLGPDPGHCVDKDPNCPSRAAAGHCSKEKADMIGDVGQAQADGRCRLSCKVCQPCAKGDKECYNNNRRNAHHLVFEGNELADASI